MHSIFANAFTLIAVLPEHNPQTKMDQSTPERMIFMHQCSPEPCSLYTVDLALASQVHWESQFGISP
jgi:hypothetical protein